ncbi:c-type cytochrome [Zoogloea sp.]|uniref:c-type cytochrome n=1 Tax=Zoogloea sp. TaxID=49181 RepID=UPI001AC2D44C|nr:c-type cytochrome [Zoogloea sp.]MBN8284748.1 c-type cytochrome [Zoogloea sp.]
MPRPTATAAIALVLGLLPLASIAAEPDPAARGRYLLAIGGCNDCHTPGFAQQGEVIPEQDRLTGAALGFSGPWGVSYPSNLRLSAHQAGEEEWLGKARRNGLPPMPWTALQAMSRDDLAAIYRYLRALGPAGNPAPAALGPGQALPTPPFVFVPQPPTSGKTSLR